MPTLSCSGSAIYRSSLSSPSTTKPRRPRPWIRRDRRFPAGKEFCALRTCATPYLPMSWNDAFGRCEYFRPTLKSHRPNPEGDWTLIEIFLPYNTLLSFFRVLYDLENADCQGFDSLIPGLDGKRNQRDLDHGMPKVTSDELFGNLDVLQKEKIFRGFVGKGVSMATRPSWFGMSWLPSGGIFAKWDQSWKLWLPLPLPQIRDEPKKLILSHHLFGR